MEIELMNGEKVKLSMNSIVTEYVASYEGGVEQMRKDIKDSRNLMYIANHIAYSVISANMKEKLSFNELMSLVKYDDVGKIIDFVNKNTSNSSIETNQTNGLQSIIKRH